MMIIVFSQPCTKSNNNHNSPCLYSEKALQSVVLRLREEMRFVDAGLGTARISMQDEPTGVPINRATSFENKVGAMDLVAGESLIKKKILNRFFMDLVAGESLIKERASARFNDLVGSTDVVAGEPLLLIPRRFRQKRAWMELNKIWRTNIKVKGLFFEKVKRGYSVAIAGFITFLPFRPRRKRKLENPRFTIKSIKLKKKKILVFGHQVGINLPIKQKKYTTISTVYSCTLVFDYKIEKAFSSIPFIAGLKTEVQSLLYLIVKFILWCILSKMLFELSRVLMEDLWKVVEPFLPSGGGRSIPGPGPGPGPSSNWELWALGGENSHGERRGSPSLSEEFPVLKVPTPDLEMLLEKLPDLPSDPVVPESDVPEQPQVQDAAHERRILEIRRDRFLERSFKNALITQERITHRMVQLLREGNNSHIPETDIRNGVDLFLTPFFEKGNPYSRNAFLKRIYAHLNEEGRASPFYSDILRDIRSI